MGAAKTLWRSAASSITASTSFPACGNTLGWVNGIQEMGKRSLNPELAFLLLDKIKEKKGKEDPGKMHLEECQAGQGREESLLKGRRTIRDQLDQQGEPERARGAAGRVRWCLPMIQGSLEGGLHTWARQLSQHNATTSRRGEIKVKRRACTHTKTWEEKKTQSNREIKIKSKGKTMKKYKAKKTPKEKAYTSP